MSNDYVQQFRKISQKFDQQIVTNPVTRQTDRQADKQTNTGERITSLAEVKNQSIKDSEPTFYENDQ